MKLALCMAFAVVIVLAVATPDHAAQPRLPALIGCNGKAIVRPQNLSFCGDGSFYLTAIQWAAWDASGAVAAAAAHQNDCKPFCAVGHFHTYPVAVWLTRPRVCSDKVFQYTRLAYEFLAQTPTGIGRGPHRFEAPPVPVRCP